MVYPTLMVFIASLLDLIAELPLLCASDDLIENITPGGPTTALCKVQGS